MTLTFNQTAYCSLLTEVAPQVIETEQEYDRILAVAEQLTFKKNRTTEEQVLYKLLVTLIETYEAQHYPMAQAAPHEILQHILESSGTPQVDLVGVIGSSSVVSEVVNGNCPINKAQAIALGDFFRVSPTLFS
ncbi:MAG: transcriptional regulator [Symploca sp. SIO2D2]|nr:transcriptional regulator [Symploca sp. SIO2D2]